MGRQTYLVRDGVLLGVVVLGGSGDDEDDLGGEGGDNLGSARGLGSEVDVDTLGLLDVDGGESSVGLDVNLLTVQDINAGDDIVEDNVDLGATLCRSRLRAWNEPKSKIRLARWTEIATRNMI